MLPWQNIAEPHRTSTFALGTGAEQSGVDVHWNIDGAARTGATVEHTFNSTGQKAVTVTVLSGGNVLSSYVGEVMVKYVRREIRTLSDADRNKFLDALQTVYTVSTVEGKDTYGSSYRGIEYYIRKHLYGAADRSCDHWHDDAGIMTHHVGFTLEFERNLQLINPQVSMPYWEYTIDDYEYCVQSGSTTCFEFSIATESPLFTDTWFGEASGSGSGHSIRGGRWANLSVLENARNFSKITNSYGLLRSPWNTDPTPNVMRHAKVNGGSWEPMVGCSRWDACFSSESLGDLNNCLNGGTHGPIHILIGGQWFMNHSILTDSKSPFNGIAGPHLLLTKHMWRYGFLNCPEVCSSDTPSEHCTCSCPESVRGTSTPYEILAEKTPLMHWVASHSQGTVFYNESNSKYEIVGYSESKTEKTWSELLNALCDPGHVGEMYTSAAPYDPLFWLIHPTAERMMGWRRYMSIKGWMPLNETWGYMHSDDTSDLGRVCHWDNVSSTGLPTCQVDTCPGHGEFDVLPFPDLIETGKMPTNAELYEFINPLNPELPYTYDSFTYPQCSAQKIPIGWDKVPSKYLTASSMTSTWQLKKQSQVS